jgi:hypothetical protein
MNDRQPSGDGMAPPRSIIVTPVPLADAELSVGTLPLDAAVTGKPVTFLPQPGERFPLRHTQIGEYRAAIEMDVTARDEDLAAVRSLATRRLVALRVIVPYHGADWPHAADGGMHYSNYRVRSAG